MSISDKKKTMRTKNRKKGRFNVIDLLLVLIVLFVISAILYVFAPFSTVKNLFTSEETTIEYTIEFIGVDKKYVNEIQKNDIVVDAVSKNHIGTVQAADYNNPYTEFEAIQKKNENTLEGVLVEHPDKCNVLVTIAATAKYGEGDGYRVNGYRIAVGEKMSLVFPNYMGEGYCIDLSLES